VVEALVTATDLEVEDLADRKKVEDGIAALEKFVHSKRGGELEVTIEQDEEHDRQRVLIRTQDGPTERVTTLDFDFLSAGNLTELRQIYLGIRALGELPFVLTALDKAGQPTGEPSEIPDIELPRFRTSRPCGPRWTPVPERVSVFSATRASAR
ncbi:MAG: hypothetical protein JRG93_00400, partial [Deltaproteobacteria bacterium]|nr:hypothetical protein [Deltaproteobacteria bacterium]